MGEIGLSFGIGEIGLLLGCGDGALLFGSGETLDGGLTAVGGTASLFLSPATSCTYSYFVFPLFEDFYLYINFGLKIRWTSCATG